MKGKLITLCIAMLASVSLISLTACGSNEEAAVSSSASSTVTSETSASLGIYIYDTDNDGTPDKVVDRYGADLSELYTLKVDGIYEGENLVLPLEQTEAFVPVTELAFTVTEKTVHPDPENAFTLDLVITPENATTKEFELTTDNAEVLKIENGNITALTNGEATVTATAKAGEATATCKVIVNAEAEEAETQNEQATASGGTVYSSNTKNTYSGGSTTANVNTNTTTNTQTNNNTQTNVNNNKPNSNTNTGNTNTGNTGNTGGSNTNTGGGNIPPPAQPETPTQPETPVQPQPTVHAPIYEQKYVVDTPAWSEEVPVWGNKEIAVCNTCGADITNNIVQHTKEHTLKGEGGSWSSKVIQIQTSTKTIYHEEVGHWENILVCGGCTGTH